MGAELSRTCKVTAIEIITCVYATYNLCKMLPNATIIFIGQSANWFYHIAIALSNMKLIPQSPNNLIGLPLSSISSSTRTDCTKLPTNIKNMCDYFKSKNININNLYLMDYAISGTTIEYVHNELVNCLGAHDLNTIYIMAQIYPGKWEGNENYSILEINESLSMYLPSLLNTKLIMAEKYGIPRTVLKYTANMWEKSIPEDSIPPNGKPCVMALNTITQALFKFNEDERLLTMMYKLLNVNRKEAVQNMINTVRNTRIEPTFNRNY